MTPKGIENNTQTDRQVFELILIETDKNMQFLVKKATKEPEY